MIIKYYLTISRDATVQAFKLGVAICSTCFSTQTHHRWILLRGSSHLGTAYNYIISTTQWYAPIPTSVTDLWACEGIFFSQPLEHMKYSSLVKYIAGWWLGHPSEKYESQLG